MTPAPTETLTPRQLAALRFVARRPQCRLKDLADELGVPLGTAQRQADVLRLKGFVRKPAGTKTFHLTRSGVVAAAT